MGNNDQVKSNKLKAILGNAKQNLKKGVQIGVLGAALTTSAAITTGCNLPVGHYVNGELVEDTLPLPTEPNEPYDKVIGNRNYIFHNFMGEEPDITNATIDTDVRHYLDLGQTYLQERFASFHETLQDRPALQTYFQNFTYQNIIYQHNCGRDLDRTVNQVSALCEPYLVDIVKNLDSKTDREAFTLCYRVLASETYREGLGKYRNDADLMDKYHDERDSIMADMANHEDLQSINYQYDVDTRHCKQITDHLDILLARVVDKMSGRFNGEITIKELRQVVNLALTTNSLEAMHDYNQTTLKHRFCRMEIGITDALQTAVNTTSYNHQFDREM